MRTSLTGLLAICLVLTACGGGGGDGSAPASTLSGWYAYSDAPGYQESYTTEVEETGDRLFVAAQEFVREGSGWAYYRPAPYSPDRQQTTLSLVADGQIDGFTRYLSAGVVVSTSAFRLRADTRPTGRVTYTGDMGGHPIAGDDVPAHGLDGGTPGSYGLALLSFRARSILHVELAFNQLPPLVAQTYTLGASTLQGGGVFCEHGGEAITAGTLIVTHWDPDRVAGTWYFELSSGDDVAGVFDVPITVHQ